MSRQLSYVLVADGGTDRALVPIIEWAIHRLDPMVEILEAEFRKRTASVRDFLSTFRTGAMIVFVHRDGENASLADRIREFEGVDRGDVVPIVPIRMTEAWLLVNARAIARAADRPDAAITVPALQRLEAIANPKQVLEERLLEAAGDPTGRRRKQFHKSIVERRVNVATLIAEFSPLEALPAFQRFQSDLAAKYPYSNFSPV